METKQKSKKMNLTELPGDTLELVFSKLPFFNLPTCRLVCKSWNNLVLTCKYFHSKTSINSNLLSGQIYPYQNRLHCVDLNLKNSEGIDIVASFTFDPIRFYGTVKIINSCNGLVCCSLVFDYSCNRHIEDIYILNPMTNEYLKLPSNPNPDMDNRDEYSYGFGFSPKTMQYKIVRHSNLWHRDRLATLIEIFTFGTSTNSRQWTHVATVPLSLRHPVTYFNGALYWIGAHRSLPDTPYGIFRFDLEDDKFEEVCFSQPPRGAYFGFLTVFHDTLYLTMSYRDNFTCQVWKMEQDSSSWIKAFDVLLPKTKPYDLLVLLEIVKVYEDENILFVRVGPDLFLYDSNIAGTQILTPQVGIKIYFDFYQIDTSSFSFDSLHKILDGDG